jgi:hypothetical protein
MTNSRRVVERRERIESGDTLASLTSKAHKLQINPKQIRIDYDKTYEWDYETITLYLVYRSEETDEEVQSRLHKEEVSKERQKEQELKLLLELKSKYEGGS